MKALYILSGLLMLFSLVFAADDEKSIGKVTFPLGDNYYQKAEGKNWQSVEYRMPVFEHDKIKTTRQSRCEVTFTNRKVMRIGENSEVELVRDNQGAEQVNMDKGRAWISMFLPGGSSRLNVRTPSSVCGIRGTVYRLECDENHALFRVYEGKIEVTPFREDGQTLADSTFSVSSGEELILVNNFEEYKKQQEQAFQDFQRDDMEAFEQFKQQDQQQFRDMLQKDLEDFRKYNSLNYKISGFELEEDLKSNWVQWNRERDKLIRP